MAAGSYARIARTEEDLTGVLNTNNDDPILMTELELPCFVSAENYAFNIETMKRHLEHQGPWNPVTRTPFNDVELDLLRQLGVDLAAKPEAASEPEAAGDALEFLKERFMQRRLDLVDACMFGCDESIYTEAKFIADIEETCEQILPQIPFAEAADLASDLLRELEDGILAGVMDMDRASTLSRALRSVRHTQPPMYGPSRIDLIRQAFEAMGFRVEFREGPVDVED